MIREGLAWRDKWYYLVFSISRPSSMPDVIIAGLPKAGTWWMAKALRAHPEVEMVKDLVPGKGELRFFSIRFGLPLRQYFKLFKERRRPGILLFEKSPDYSILSERRLRLIKTLNPNIRMILIFREPVEWAFSHAKMDLVRSRNVKFEDVSDEQFFRHYRNAARKYDFEAIYQRYTKVFGDHLKVFLNEEIERDPRKVYQELCQFLGIEKILPSEFDLGKRDNVTQSLPMPDSHRTLLEDLMVRNRGHYRSLTDFRK
mgnify:FL=1